MNRVDQWEAVALCALAAFGKTPTACNGYAIASRLDRLARIARTLHRLYEAQCSEPIEVCDRCGSVAGRRHIPSQCFEARLERLEKRAASIGAELGLTVETQRDPRGASVKVYASSDDASAERGMLACF